MKKDMIKELLEVEELSEADEMTGLTDYQTFETEVAELLYKCHYYNSISEYVNIGIWKMLKQFSLVESSDEADNDSSVFHVIDGFLTARGLRFLAHKYNGKETMSTYIKKVYNNKVQPSKTMEEFGIVSEILKFDGLLTKARQFVDTLDSIRYSNLKNIIVELDMFERPYIESRMKLKIPKLPCADTWTVVDVDETYLTIATAVNDNKSVAVKVFRLPDLYDTYFGRGILFSDGSAAIIDYHPRCKGWEVTDEDRYRAVLSDAGSIDVYGVEAEVGKPVGE